MSNIRFFALGGMDETSKSAYVLEFNNEYFLFNLGINIPVYEHLGIRKVLPYIQWIKNNKKNIRGIFIGNINYKNIGGLIYCLEDIKSIPIYTSHTNAAYLRSIVNEKTAERLGIDFFPLNIKPLTSLNTLQIGRIKIVPFKLSSYAAESFGFILGSENDCVVYVDDFVVSNTNKKAFTNDLTKLPFLLHQYKNKLLIVNAGIVAKNKGFSAPHYELKDFYEERLVRTNNKRLLVPIFSHDTHTLLTLAEIAKNKQVPFIIYNPPFINVFNEMITNKIFNPSNLLFLPVNKINEIKKGIVVISQTPDRLYYKLISIAENNDDILALKKTDHMVLGFKSDPGFEKLQAEILDAYANLNLEIFTIPSTSLPIEASRQDHQFLVNLVRPNYIIPTLGLYSSIMSYMDAMEEINFPTEKVFCLYNGEIVQIRDAEAVVNTQHSNYVHEFYLGSHGFLTEGDNILKERAVMSENGVVFCSVKINPDFSISQQNYHFIEHGLVGLDDEKMYKLEEIKVQTYQFITECIADPAMRKDDFKEFKNMTKRFVSRSIDRLLDKFPIIVISIF